MARVSNIERNKKRVKISQQPASKRKRAAWKEDIRIGNPQEKQQATLKMQKAKRDSSPVRVRRVCQVCGRPRGNLRRFNLCRMHLREAMMRGEVPGGRKSSW